MVLIRLFYWLTCLYNCVKQLIKNSIQECHSPRVTTCETNKNLHTAAENNPPFHSFQSEENGFSTISKIRVQYSLFKSIDKQVRVNQTRSILLVNK